MTSYNVKILKIVHFPDINLYKQSRITYKINSSLFNFVFSLIATLQFSKGLGLAAVQVGIMQNIILVNQDTFDTENACNCTLSRPLLFINTVLLYQKCINTSSNEGCLSLPNTFFSIYRLNNVIVNSMNLYMQNKTIHYSKKLIPICLQHELEHCRGIFLMDYLSCVTRNLILNKILNLFKVKF